MKYLKLFEDYNSSDLKEIAEYFFNSIDTNKKSQTIKYKKHIFIRKKQQGYYPEYFIDGWELDYSNIRYMDKEEIVEYFIETMEKALEKNEENKDKIIFSEYELRDFVIDILKDINVSYSITNAIKTSSMYIKTDKGTIRISDHTGNFREYNDVIKYLFSGEYYNPIELRNEIINIFI